jgi:hypothetical protein
MTLLRRLWAWLFPAEQEPEDYTDCPYVRTLMWGPGDKLQVFEHYRQENEHMTIGEREP